MRQGEDGHWRQHGEPPIILDEPDPDSPYRDKSLNPEWVAWYDEMKARDLILAKNRMEYEAGLLTDAGKAQKAEWDAEREATRDD